MGKPLRASLTGEEYAFPPLPSPIIAAAASTAHALQTRVTKTPPSL